jgi:N,N'-diacetyllegionaminate synthase
MKKIQTIAEIANAHEGLIRKASQLVEAAADAKADIVKFQLFTADELLTKNHPEFKHYKKLTMTQDEWKKLVKIARKRKLKIFFDVFGLKSAKLAKNFNADGYKIHLSDITNPDILNYFSSSKKPILLSTAGANEIEIQNAIDVLTKRKKEITLMHGYQGFPTNINDLNLKRILELKTKFDLPIGIMDHISGDSNMSQIIPLLALTLGVSIIEKHITLNRNEKGIDYYSSLEPNEFKNMTKLIKNTVKTFGNQKIMFSDEEIKYRLKHKKKSIAKKFIKKGSRLKIKDFEFKRNPKKVESVSYFDFEKKDISSDIQQGEILTKKILKSSPKIAAVLACRNDSDRMYGKPLQKMGKFVILHHLINQIKTSKKIDEIVLAISEKPGNEIFIEFAKNENLKFVIGDDKDVLDRLIVGAKLVDAQIIFRVTSENPYIFWEGIDSIISKHVDEKFDFSFYDSLPIGSSYEIINLNSLEKSHKQGKDKHRSELCSLYIRENQKKFKINKMKPPKSVSYPNIRLTVDTPEDLILIRLIHSKLGKLDKPIVLKKVIKFLESNKKLMEINSEIPLGVTRIWY